MNWTKSFLTNIQTLPDEKKHVSDQRSFFQFSHNSLESKHSIQECFFRTAALARYKQATQWPWNHLWIRPRQHLWARTSGKGLRRKISLFGGCPQLSLWQVSERAIRGGWQRAGLTWNPPNMSKKSNMLEQRNPSNMSKATSSAKKSLQCQLQTSEVNPASCNQK